jgi:hypothetical protein
MSVVRQWRERRTDGRELNACAIGGSEMQECSWRLLAGTDSGGCGGVSPGGGIPLNARSNRREELGMLLSENNSGTDVKYHAALKCPSALANQKDSKYLTSIIADWLVDPSSNTFKKFIEAILPGPV